MKKKVILGLLSLVLVVGMVYASGSCREDFNQDGNVDFADFTLFASAYDSKIGDGNYDVKFDLDGEKGALETEGDEVGEI